MRAPELRATFARLEIACGPDVITQVEDKSSESSRRSIYVPLYPLAEWFAYNWWFLSSHRRPESIPRAAWSFRRRQVNVEREWLRHHNVAAVADGFFWPDLAIVPESPTRAALVWHAQPESSAHTRFTSQGACTVPAAELRGAVSSFVNDVLNRLREQGVTQTPLEEEWTDLETLDEGDAQFCRAAAALGLDPSTTPAAVDELILHVDERLSAALLDDFLNSAEPTLLEEDLNWIDHAAMVIAKRPKAKREQVPPIPLRMGDAPWDQGYHVAREFRKKLGLAPTDRGDPESFIAVLVEAAPDRAMDALGGPSKAKEPVLVLGRERPARSQRFAAARALMRLQGTSDHYLITNAYGETQKRERSFAAEFLAPALGLLDVLGTDAKRVTSADIAVLSDHFDVQELVVAHQVENNLGLAVERDVM